MFNPNTDEVEDFKRRYREGTVGDVEVKASLAAAINKYLDPFRERRKEFESEKGYVEKIVYDGTQKMIECSNQTLKEAKSAMGLAGGWKKISKLAKEYSVSV